MEKARRGEADVAKPRKQTRLMDDLIRDLWLELNSRPPLTVEEFLNDMYEVENQKMYRWLDRRM